MKKPFPSCRQLVYGRGMVATGNTLAAAAGLEILKKGGNAVDAALAMAAALTVVEPTSNGLGGDCFALLWKDGQLHGLNASGPAPKAMTAAELRRRGHETMPQRGAETVTVPGVTAGWAALSERFGTLPLSDAVEPAARLAEEGFLLQPVVSQLWRQAAQTFAQGEAFESWRETFGSWRAEEGDLVLLPRHAETLRAIGATKGRYLYSGLAAERLAEAVKAQGGFLSAEDLASYSPEWVTPLSVDYRGVTVHELPPNGHGITVLMALQMLSHLSDGGDEGTKLHHRVEALKLAMTDGRAWVADPASMKCDPQDLLDETYAALRAKKIGPRALLPEAGCPPRGGTVYLTAADRFGTMVSMIQSNYMGFGSGLVVPDLGVALHNRGANFSLQEGHPNEAGPGKRPYHTIIPGLITRNGDALGTFGVMGGFMQPQGHLQVLTGLFDDGLTPQEALDRPRWRWEGGLKVSVESTFDDELKEKLIRRGHDLSVDPSPLDFGRGQIILKVPFGYVGATEPRTDGAVLAC